MGEDSTRKGVKTLPMILIGLSPLSMFSQEPAMARVAPSSPQPVAVATAEPPTTGEAIEKND